MTNAFNEQPLLQFDQAAQPAAFDRATTEFSKDHRKRLRDCFMRAGPTPLQVPP